MKIGTRQVGLDHPPVIIAEIGVNHDGRLDRGVHLVEIARDAGADAIKLQLFQAERLLSQAARLAQYQARAQCPDAMAMLGALELSLSEIETLAGCAREAGMGVVLSIFSVELVAEARALSVDAGKIASPDIINRPLIEAMLETGRPLLLSTGAATLAEVREAASWLGGHEHLFMHCVSSYPTPDDQAALGGRAALLEVTPHALGYSDHTTSTDTGALAVAGGTCVLEKHVTYDRSAAGPDHAASLEGPELAEYVRLAHRAWRMRGPIRKRVADIEQDVRAASRQSLTTTRRLPAGHVIAPDDLTIKRPGSGLPPSLLDSVIGRALTEAVEADQPLTEAHLT